MKIPFAVTLSFLVLVAIVLTYAAVVS